MQHMQKYQYSVKHVNAIFRLKSLGIAIYTLMFYQADRNVIHIYFFTSE